jgi:hypothetical protein
MPTNLGGGTNETRLIAFPRPAVYVGLGPIRVTVTNAPSAGSIGTTFTAYRYVAVMGIWPAAIGVLSGTGMAAVAS